MFRFDEFLESFDIVMRIRIIRGEWIVVCNVKKKWKLFFWKEIFEFEIKNVLFKIYLWIMFLWKMNRVIVYFFLVILIFVVILKFFEGLLNLNMYLWMCWYLWIIFLFFMFYLNFLRIVLFFVDLVLVGYSYVDIIVWFVLFFVCVG